VIKGCKVKHPGVLFGHCVQVLVAFAVTGSIIPVASQGLTKKGGKYALRFIIKFDNYLFISRLRHPGKNAGAMACTRGPDSQ
jgi:hypothetical protein